jgi:hypothetical protein
MGISPGQLLVIPRNSGYRTCSIMMKDLFPINVRVLSPGADFCIRGVISNPYSCPI